MSSPKASRETKPCSLGDSSLCSRRGSFQLSPPDDKDLDYDFEQVGFQLNPLDPESSNLLTKPLDPAAGGAVHSAPSDPHGFLSTSDPDYQAILAWIQAGELE